jgi:two-component system LytT family response regulator
MPSFTCIIIDDEKLARTKLYELLKVFPDWEVIGQAGEFNEALQLVEDLKPDACFVDINIIGGSGIELVNRLHNRVDTQFVFSTAYSEHAITAFELNASDYLLKPFSQERFAQVLMKLETQLINSTAPPHAHKKSILAVKSIGSVQFVDVKDLIWIKGAANYVELHFKDKMLLHRETLSNLETKLDRQKFVRVHRSAMVNLESIDSLSSELGRLSLLHLSNGDEVKISTSHKTKLFECLGLDEQ